MALIRSLARLYGLPMTGYEAGKVLKTILFSSGGLLLGEIGSSVLLGLGKSATAIASGDNPINVTAYAGSAIAQAGIAGYGAYAVGKAAQVYLERGCSWGQLGASTVIQEILGSGTEYNLVSIATGARFAQSRVMTASKSKSLLSSPGYRFPVITIRTPPIGARVNPRR